MSKTRKSPQRKRHVVVTKASRAAGSRCKQKSDTEEGTMLFVSGYTVSPENRNAAQERFKKTGGQPPKGVKMIGRWHSAAGGRGVTVWETDDAQVLAAWVHQWSDLLSFDIYPALDDAGVGKLLG
jgi:hypothetical protein